MTSTPVATTTLVQSSVANFKQNCASLEGVSVLGRDGGTLALAGADADSFESASLASSWVSGSWSGGSYTPSLTAGTLTLPGGGFVRSQSSYTHASLAMVASFGAGPWQHLGFGALDFAGDTYLLFSTFNGSSNLYARANVGSGEQTVNLGAIPSGPHEYQVDWAAGSGSDQVVFLVDGVVRASLSLPSSPHNLYVYLSNNGSASLGVDELVRSPRYEASGSYTSCVLDAGAEVWQTLSWTARLASSTSLSVEVRTSADGVSWSGWDAASANGMLANPARLLQYRVHLATSDPNQSPLLDAVTLTSSP